MEQTAATEAPSREYKYNTDVLIDTGRERIILDKDQEVVYSIVVHYTIV